MYMKEITTENKREREREREIMERETEGRRGTEREREGGVRQVGSATTARMPSEVRGPSAIASLPTLNSPL